MPAGFTVLAFNTSVGGAERLWQREIVMKLNTQGYCHLATDVLDWVHSKRNALCVRQDAGQDTKRKPRYTCIDTCKHLQTFAKERSLTALVVGITMFVSQMLTTFL